MKKFLTLLLCMAALFTGCEKQEIQDLKDRIEKLEGENIAPIETQIESINASITDLKAVSNTLDTYTQTLEATAQKLEEELASTNAQIDQLKNELQEENSATKQELLQQLDELKTTIEADLMAIKQEIASLKAKDAELESKINNLKSYIDQELSASKEWANATFATLEQYDDIQSELAGIKSLITTINATISDLETRINNKIATDIDKAISDLRAEVSESIAANIATAVTKLTTAYTEAIATAKEEITAAYTEAISKAISASEESMKTWVNKTLAEGYYDIAKIDALLAALESKLAGADSDIAKQIADQQAALNKAKEELTAAYQEAIADAIETNNGVINKAIAEAVQDALNKVDIKLAIIDNAIAAIQKDIEAIKTDIDSLKSSIATINQQITAINGSIDDLKAVDTQLSGYISALQTTAANLQSQIDATNTALAALESDLEGQITASEQKVLNELNTVKTALEGQLATINNTIQTLQAKDKELEQKIADLQKYVDDELKSTKDWASATFSTLEQYQATQTAISQINALITSTQASITALEEKLGKKIEDDIAAAVAGVNAAIAAKVTEITGAYTEAIKTAKAEITAAYTEAINTAITASESSMKEWVNGVLADGYYKKAEIDGKITALTTQVTEGDEALQNEIDALETALAKAESDLTAAYKQAIKDAINENNGKISNEIAAAVKTAQDNLQAQIDAINIEIEKIKARLDIIEADINTIKQQITAITASIDDLEMVDETLKSLIDDLQDEAANLQNQLDANSAADAATKQALEAEITSLKALITALQAKDAALEQQIAELKNYVDTEIGATEDWAEATFATLQQYDALQTTIANISALVETNKSELNTAIATAVSNMQNQLNALENSMKAWVNETLANGYYDIATIDSKLAALKATQDALANNGATDQELAAAIAAQQDALNQAKNELTAAYKAAITEAINNNNGIIDTKIANAIATAKAELQSQITTINTAITAIQNRLTKLEGRIQSIRFVPEYSDGKVELTSDNAPVTLTFLLSPSAAAQAVATAYQRNSDVVTAYISRTKSRTRAVDTPTAITVNKVEGTAEGMLTVTVSTASLPADYWADADEANLFIRISDGNNDIISEMIPTFYTKPCMLPDGNTFNLDVSALLTDDIKTIKFIAGSKEVTNYQIGSSTAYMKVNGQTLEIHTVAKKFVFDTNCYKMFKNFDKITTIDFNDCINTANVTDMNSMFYECKALTSLDLSGFNTTNVKNMGYMFTNCQAFISLNLSGFNTTNVTDMNGMFYGCEALSSLDLSGFNTTNVKSMWYMFSGCEALTSLDLSDFNTTNVTDMSGMFYSCQALTSLDLSGFNTTNVEYMEEMFVNCLNLATLDIRNFNVSEAFIDSIFDRVGETYFTQSSSKAKIKVTTQLKNTLESKNVSPGDYAEYEIVSGAGLNNFGWGDSLTGK